MKRRAGKGCVWVFALTIIAMAAGCEEQVQYNPKRERLVANELRKQLQECQKEVETQKQLVAKCEQEKKDTVESIQRSAQQLADGVLKDMEENIKLREENKKLKAQVEEIKAEIKKLKEAQ